MSQGLQTYLDNAVSILNKFGVGLVRGEETKVATLLEDVVSVDEPSVIAISRTLQYAGTFNELVRNNVKDMKIGERYKTITEMFDSIREDSKKLLSQIEDGKIDSREKIQNAWMKLTRGTPHKRFEKIKDMYESISNDTKIGIDRESEIIRAYVEFRFALKQTEAIARDLLKKQENILDETKKKYEQTQDDLKKLEGSDTVSASELSKMELARDEAADNLRQQDRKYQLIKDVSENITVGYSVGETLVSKLLQTHQVKEQVYRRAVTFFETNEHVFTTLDAVYSSQFGLHEATQTLESMKDGVNKGIEDVAALGGKVEKAGLKSGYGATLNKDSVSKLIDSIVNYQKESIQLIEQYRLESTKNAADIESIVNSGKQQLRETSQKYVAPPN